MFDLKVQSSIVINKNQFSSIFINCLTFHNRDNCLKYL